MREQNSRTVLLKDCADHGSDRTWNADAVSGKALEVRAEAFLIEMRNPQTLRGLIAALNACPKKITSRRDAVQFSFLQRTFGQHPQFNLQDFIQFDYNCFGFG